MGRFDTDVCIVVYQVVRRGVGRVMVVLYVYRLYNRTVGLEIKHYFFNFLINVTAFFLVPLNCHGNEYVTAIGDMVRVTCCTQERHETPYIGLVHDPRVGRRSYGCYSKYRRQSHKLFAEALESSSWRGMDEGRSDGCQIPHTLVVQPCHQPRARG